MKRVVVGGTFEFLHKGHRALLDKAFNIGDKIFIGITADDFKKDCTVSFEERKKSVEKYIKRFKKSYKIEMIKDRFGPTLEEDFDIIIVSRETRKTAEDINKLRNEKGLKSIEIVEIPIFYAQDLLPISSRRIRYGEIDIEGRRLIPLKVNVGSANPSKIKAVKKIFEKIFSFKVIVKGIDVNSSVSPQPIDDETIFGAINRAKNALENADYSVGIEAGLFWNKDLKKYFDKAFCVILDKYGKFTYGYSGGFIYPPKVIEMVKKGYEVGEAMEIISGIPDIKKKMGAIGFLSKGKIDRVEFNSQAVLMAMIPRLSHELYF